MSEKEQSPIYDIKVSVALPGLMSGFMNTAQELAALDLAMKLHYMRVVYYFKTPTFDGLNISNIKETMYSWLSHASVPCGRIRRTESGRPFIKCNVSGSSGLNVV